MESAFSYGGSGINSTYERMVHPEEGAYGQVGRKAIHTRKLANGEKVKIEGAMIRKPKRPVIPLSVVSNYLRGTVANFMKLDKENDTPKVSSKAKIIAHSWITRKLSEQIGQAISFMKSAKRVTLQPRDFMPCINDLARDRTVAPQWSEMMQSRFNELKKALSDYVLEWESNDKTEYDGKVIVVFKALEQLVGWNLMELSEEGIERHALSLVRKNHIKDGRVGNGVKIFIAILFFIQLYQLVMGAVVVAIRSGTHRVVLQSGDFSKAIGSRPMISDADYEDIIIRDVTLGDYVPKNDTLEEAEEPKKGKHHKKASSSPKSPAKKKSKVMLFDDLEDEEESPSYVPTIFKSASKSPKPPTVSPLTPSKSKSKSKSAKKVAQESMIL